MKLRFIGASLVVAVMALVGVASGSKEMPFCKKMALWAEVHAEGIDTLEEMSTLTIEQRKAVFMTLTAEEKYRVALEQKKYIESHGLTDEQRLVLDKLFEWASPDQIKRRERVPAKVMEGIKKEFSRDQIERFFLTIGPLPKGEPGIVPASYRKSAFSCECASQSDYCFNKNGDGRTYWCNDWACAYDSGLSGGCGTMWWYDCDGVCWQHNPQAGG